MSETATLLVDTLVVLEQTFTPFLLFLKELFFLFWWVPIPFILFPQLQFAYLLYKSTQFSMTHDQKVLLEIKIPPEVTRPLRAMENVFNTVWSLYDPPSFRELWFMGKYILAFNLEIVSIEGIPHFYIRVPKGARNSFESAIYSQFSDVEITEVSDYTQNVPQDLPNSDWDLWGADFMLAKPDVYPIKTYEQFFEERPDSPAEEKRIDPLSDLLEIMSKLGKDEQLWIQMRLSPVTNKQNNFIDRAREILDKMLKRATPKPVEFKPMAQEALEIFVSGKPGEMPKEEQATDSLMFSEFMLTSGEREVVSAIEKKVSKPMYNTAIRFIYLAKREAFFGPAKGYAFNFFSQFSSHNLNFFAPIPETMTKIKSPNIFTKRRLHFRQRNMFLRYINRETAFDPYPGGTFILNSEEVATLFHFPGMEVAPTKAVPRVEIKKAPPPSDLPIE